MTTSYQYLYDMPFGQLTEMFVTGAMAIVVNDKGVQCIPAEAHALRRLARAVENRTDSSELGCALRSLARTVTTLVMKYVVAMGGQRPPAADATVPLGEVGTRAHDDAGIVGHFYRDLAAVTELLEPLPAHHSVPDAPTPNLIESLRHDGDGLPEAERDDTELPIDSPEVRAMVAADPELRHFINMAAIGIHTR
ncbi:hypothetical protein A5714_11625 [Mycobacterium sp. E2462]|uniref:hypothetical protein n=1 Tax=Mycobacterium sp. E2462 TaxID=1834133 RepID=UPI0007FCF6B8|nr:hypothetical protein [Mycobacterium sp. E2462]OBI16010.1 hypothetical protein A5714_11625 [Mycobacterium sp. E2462]